MNEQKFHAVVMNGYGPPHVLQDAQVSLAPLKDREVRIRTLASAVNFTDLQIRSGNWPIRRASPFPYTPGVEVVGVVEEIGHAVAGWSPGQTVITMMQGLGGVRAERPGGYSELVTVDADAIAEIPQGVSPMEMAALGLVAVTALRGLSICGPIAGRHVLVTGASSSVGSAAIAIAHAQGASVTALVTRTEDVTVASDSGADEVVVAPRTTIPSLKPGTFDYVLDSVGGVMFGACVNALRHGGGLVLVGAVGGGNVTFDAWQLIRPISLTGYSTETLVGADLRESIRALGALRSSGAIPAPRYSHFPLSKAPQVHMLLERGEIRGRVLLLPD